MLARCQHVLLKGASTRAWEPFAGAARREIADGKFLPRIGQVFETETVLDADRVAQFVSITGDTNSLHEAPPGAPAGVAIVPGSMCAALFPAVIGSAFPGALYLSQTLKFRNPAPVGSKVCAEVTVERVRGSRVSFNTVCRLVDPPHERLVGAALGGAEVAVVAGGVTVVDGSALALLKGWAPTFDETEEEEWDGLR